MQGFSTHIDRMEDSEAILEYVYAACREQGARWFSYHFTPIFDSPSSKSTFIWARDYPYELQKIYMAEGVRDIDPVPRMTFEHGPVLTWRRAWELGGKDPASARYFEVSRKHHIRNWAGFALYGPRNRDAFAALTFDDDPDRFEAGRISHLHTLLQSAHFRICAVIDETNSQVSLSDRERQVLAWMGRGKSAVDIAAILEISPETVKTYIKRLYDKLQANDRVTATVRALKLGLVEL